MSRSEYWSLREEELVRSLIVKFADNKGDLFCLEQLLKAGEATWEEFCVTKRRLRGAKSALLVIQEICRAGYIHLLQSALSLDPSLANICDENNSMSRPVQLAAARGHADVVHILIKAGADISGHEEDGHDWPLLLAAESGSIETVRILLEAEPKVTLDGEWTALHWMAEQGRKHAVETLIKCGVSANVKDKSGTTPLHVAAISCAEDIVVALLAAGADINAVTSRKETVLHSAAVGGCPQLVRLLLADTSCVDMRDSSGRTPLHVASLWGNLEAAKELIKAGADKAASNTRGRTPYDLACRRGHTHVMRLLRDNEEPLEDGQYSLLTEEQ